MGIQMRHISGQDMRISPGMSGHQVLKPRHWLPLDADQSRNSCFAFNLSNEALRLLVFGPERRPFPAVAPRCPVKVVQAESTLLVLAHYHVRNDDLLRHGSGLCGLPANWGGAFGASNESPVNIRTHRLASNDAARLALNFDAEPLSYPLANRNGFSEIADAGVAPSGELVTGSWIEPVEEDEKLVHAVVLPFGNALSTPFGDLPFGKSDLGMAVATDEALEDTENRRRQLRAWIEAHYESQADFVIKNKLNQGEISGLLRTKSFGSVKARRLELQAQLPSRYLDQRPFQAIGTAPATGSATLTPGAPIPATGRATSASAMVQRLAELLRGVPLAQREGVARELSLLAQVPDSAELPRSIAAALDGRDDSIRHGNESATETLDISPDGKAKPWRLQPSTRRDDGRHQSSRYIGQERNRPATKPKKQSIKK